MTSASLLTLVSAIISNRSLSIPALKRASPVGLGGGGRVERGRSVVFPCSAAAYCRVGSTLRYPEMSGRGGGGGCFLIGCLALPVNLGVCFGLVSFFEDF
ncbi:hypothetical protein NPIL_51151 [Nephila pilipes]|uniref:Uncharacterized protein n=1 Tax=Nephila pilipes TaxID=299642 RepID=A0A8X6P8V1_NEPPI|nr:hypothetical protein NPIL_51151 [Nephila pilipes]